MATQLHTAPLKERIAALQGKAGGPLAAAAPASRSTSPLPHAGSSSGSGGLSLPGGGGGGGGSLARSGTVRDKAARFEEKGGMPVPRGAFGMSLPPEHVPKDVRKGQLYGNRIPELGRGESRVLSTHSRNVSGSYSDVSHPGDDDDYAGGSRSRSASPAPGSMAIGARRRTTSTSFGPASLRRMSQASNADRVSLFSASNPDLTDSFGDADIPPVPPLPPTVAAAQPASPPPPSPQESLHSPPPAAPDVLPEVQPTTTTDSWPVVLEYDLDSDEPTVVINPMAVAQTVPDEADSAPAKAAAVVGSIPTSPVASLPVPNVRIHIVDHLEPQARPVSIAQSELESEPDSPLFYVPPSQPTSFASERSSIRSHPPPSLHFSDRRSDSDSVAAPRTSMTPSEPATPATPSDILTPSTMDAFPSPPTLSPSTTSESHAESRARTPSRLSIAPSPPPSVPLPSPPTSTKAAKSSGRISHSDARTSPSATTPTITTPDSDAPPPLPPKDIVYNPGQRANGADRKASVDSTRTSETSHTSSQLITPPTTTGRSGNIVSTGLHRSNSSVRKPLVIPNWWEDDDDEPAEVGWVRVVSRK